MNTKLKSFLKEFKIPIIVLVGIISYLILANIGMSMIANALILFIIGLGSYDLVKDSLNSLLKGEYVLDYIAILAIAVSVITGEYLVGSIIALMITSGRTLEDYGVAKAKQSLTALSTRVPQDVLRALKGSPGEKVKVAQILVGDEIYVRKGEVIALDGELVSDGAVTDESSLTGEAYPVEKVKGDHVYSGTINVGEAIIIKVLKSGQNSTYNKIVEMVRKAQGEKAPMIRLADKYSTVFTILTFLIAGGAYLLTQDLDRVLAVLVVATPCPLILATPIALLGGLNAAAKKRIIVKKLSSLESLSRINAMIFDKTGTITLGIPMVVRFETEARGQEKQKLLAAAEAIERSSLHPLAKAIVRFAKDNQAKIVRAENIEEKIGHGIEGQVEGVKYLLSKLETGEGMGIQIKSGGKQLGVFYFEDQIKKESRQILGELKSIGFDLHIYTGDKKEAAEKVVKLLDSQISFKAECSPEDKQQGIQNLKTQGKVVGMVGDGINDAPALALADVGMVFSNEEQTASTEAADVVFLNGGFEEVKDVITISKRTISIALQSIVWGIGLSVVAMVFASAGYIPPIMGAMLQEAIDVAVIINALRAAR